MAPVIDVTTADLSRRRDEILARLAVSAEEFRSLSENRTLTGDEWEAKEELDAIEFLLGKDHS